MTVPEKFPVQSASPVLVHDSVAELPRVIEVGDTVRVAVGIGVNTVSSTYVLASPRGVPHVKKSAKVPATPGLTVTDPVAPTELFSDGVKNAHKLPDGEVQDSVNTAPMIPLVGVAARFTSDGALVDTSIYAVPAVPADSVNPGIVTVNP